MFFLYLQAHCVLLVCKSRLFIKQVHTPCNTSNTFRKDKPGYYIPRNGITFHIMLIRTFCDFNISREYMIRDLGKRREQFICDPMNKWKKGRKLNFEHLIRRKFNTFEVSVLLIFCRVQNYYLYSNRIDI